MDTGGSMTGKSDDRFERVVAPVILRHEGHFANHPNDPGGETMFGISLRFAQSLGDADGDGTLDVDLDGDGDVDGGDIRMMKRDVAIHLYKTQWWNAFGYGRIIDDAVATKLCDLAVNMSARRAHRCLQRALRACGMPVKEDGVLGAITITAVNATPAWVLLAAFRSEAAGHYRMLHARRKAAIERGAQAPSLDPFIAGWLNRAYS